MCGIFRTNTVKTHPFLWFLKRSFILCKMIIITPNILKQHYFKEESSILEKRCWYLKLTVKQIHTSLLSAPSEDPPTTSTRTTATLKTTPPSPSSSPSPSPVLWLAGIHPLLLLDWNSVVWLGPSHFIVFPFIEPELCTSIGFFSAHTSAH